MGFFFSFLVALYLLFPFCMDRSNTASPEEAGQSGSEDLHPWVRRFERGPADWSRGGKRAVAAALGAVRTGAEREPALWAGTDGGEGERLSAAGPSAQRPAGFPGVTPLLGHGPREQHSWETQSPGGMVNYLFRIIKGRLFRGGRHGWSSQHLFFSFRL